MVMAYGGGGSSNMVDRYEKGGGKEGGSDGGRLPSYSPRTPL